MTRRSVWTVIGIVAALLAAVDAAESQEMDARVLPPGQLRLMVGGDYLHMGTEFAEGGRRALCAGLGGPLDPTTFSPLGALGADLEEFFAATPAGPFPVTAADLFAGDLEADLSWNTRTVPFRLSVGVVPRVEVGAGISTYRHERLARGIGISGGVLGANPDSAANVALLRQIDESFADLGRAPLLPVAGSALGQELRRRILEATGEDFLLPEAAAGIVDLRDAFGVDLPPYLLSDWVAGDLELDARVEILRSFEDPFYPPDEADIEYRVAVGGSVRIPTSERVEVDPVFDWSPRIGHGSVRLEAVGDLFYGDRGWVSGGGSFTRVSAADVRIATFTGSPFAPGEVSTVAARRSPGNETVLWVQPRFRVTRDLSIGAFARSDRRAAGSETAADITTSIDAATSNSLGVSLRYSTLSAHRDGLAFFPGEAVVGFSRVVSGAVGEPVTRLGYVRLSLHYQLWGRREAD
jgi:hypothetical protein